VSYQPGVAVAARMASRGVSFVQRVLAAMMTRGVLLVQLVPDVAVAARMTSRGASLLQRVLDGSGQNRHCLLQKMPVLQLEARVGCLVTAVSVDDCWKTYVLIVKSIL